MRVSEVDECTRELIIIDYLVNRVVEQHNKAMELWEEFKLDQKKLEEERHARKSFLYL